MGENTTSTSEKKTRKKAVKAQAEEIMETAAAAEASAAESAEEASAAAEKKAPAKSGKKKAAAETVSETVPETAAQEPAPEKKKTSAKKKSAKKAAPEMISAPEETPAEEEIPAEEETRAEEAEPGVKKAPAKKRSAAKKKGEKKGSGKEASSEKSGEAFRADTPELQGEDFLNVLNQLVSQARSKDSKLDYDEINEYIGDFHVSPEAIDKIYAYLESQGIQVINEAPEEAPADIEIVQSASRNELIMQSKRTWRGGIIQAQIEIENISGCRAQFVCDAIEQHIALLQCIGNQTAYWLHFLLNADFDAIIDLSVKMDAQIRDGHQRTADMQQTHGGMQVIGTF